MFCFVRKLGVFFYGSHEQDIRFQRLTAAHNGSQRLASPVKKDTLY